MADAPQKHRAVPLIEKVTATLGLLLILSVAGTLGYEALRAGTTPPMIEVHVQDVQEHGDRYLVRFTARNRGDSTAAQVTVAGELKDGERLVEQSTAMLSYVPDRAEQEGGLIFSLDPRGYRLQLRATGYEKP